MVILIVAIALILLVIYKLIMPVDIYKPESYDNLAKRIGTMQLTKLKLDTSNAVYIGNSGRKKVFIPHNTAHVFVCGTTGGGKTIALANFIKSGIENDLPMLLVDGKGDIGTGSMLDIVQRMKQDKKLYVINLNNPSDSDKYNPFCNTTATIIKDMLINLTEWSEEHYKINAERYLQKVIDLMRLNKQPLSFKSIIENMPISKFLELSAILVKKEILTKEEHLALTEIAEQSGKVAQGSIARFSSVIENELGGIFDAEGIDIYTALEEKAIIMFILNPLSYPVLSPLVGKLAIIDCKKAVSKIYNNDLGRILFLFDEINVYASRNFLDLINKSRSAQVTCVLATQSLSDLDEASPTLKEQIIENCNNYIIMRQNSAVNAEQWSNVIGTRETIELTHQIESEGATGRGSARRVREFIFHPDDIKQLGTGESFYVSKDNKIRCRVDINKPF